MTQRDRLHLFDAFQGLLIRESIESGVALQAAVSKYRVDGGRVNRDKACYCRGRFATMVELARVARLPIDHILATHDLVVSRLMSL